MNALFTVFQNGLNVASISEQTHMAVFTFSMKLLPIKQSSWIPLAYHSQTRNDPYIIGKESTAKNQN